MNKRRTSGCIEAAYALLFLISLGFLLWEFGTSFVSVCVDLINWSGHPTVKELNDWTFEFAVCFALVASLVQFARIHHFIHEFDCCHNDNNHFISYLRNPHRVWDRVLRGAAGILIILTIEIWAEQIKDTEHSPLQRFLNFLIRLLHAQDVDSKYSLLLVFAIALFFVFLFLAGWDWNLRSWQKTKPPLSAEAEKVLKEYDPGTKKWQRIWGLAFSFFLFLTVKFPDVLLVSGLTTLCLGLFLAFWCRDYRNKGISRFFREIFSPVETLFELVRHDGTTPGGSSPGGSATPQPVTNP